MHNDQGSVIDQSKYDYHVCHVKCVSWTAVVAGALVGIGISFLLNLFSVAIGLSVFPTTEAGVMSLAVGGFIGVVIGSFVAMFVAGWVAGYLGRPYCYKRNFGVLYGFLAWCLALLITVVVSTHVGHYVSSYSNFITNPANIVVNDNNKAAVVVSEQKPARVVIDVEQSANHIAVGAFVIFLLFVIGALGSCFGGHFGMACRHDNEDVTCGLCPPRR